MNSLMLHCGSEAIGRNDLHNLPTPSAQGARHVIRPFAEDVELVHDFMDRSGIRIDDEAYGVLYGPDRTPRRFFGVMQVRIDALDGRDGYGLMVGLRGSYDQSLSRALAVGSRVFVCDNLSFSGEIDIRTKQTTNIGQRLPALLGAAVEQIPSLATHQRHRFDQYRNHQISKVTGDHLLVELVRRKALMPSHLGTALREWDEPSHGEHGNEGFSLWRLHNAVTEAIKPSNPERAAVPVTWERTRTMTAVLDAEAGLYRVSEAA